MPLTSAAAVALAIGTFGKAVSSSAISPHKKAGQRRGVNRREFQSKLSIVCARGNCSAVSGPIGVEEFTARFVHPFVGMGAEVIALSLEQVSRQTFRSVLIVESQRG